MDVMDRLALPTSTTRGIQSVEGTSHSTMTAKWHWLVSFKLWTCKLVHSFSRIHSLYTSVS